MALFGKRPVAKAPSRGGENVNAPVKVLGGGCANCRALGAAAEAALRELGMDPAVEHVTDYAKIAAYGVMSTPALVVDGRVVSAGKVLNTKEVKELLQKSRG